MFMTTNMTNSNRFSYNMYQNVGTSPIPNQNKKESAINDITMAINEIAEGNCSIDFEEFLDVLFEINIDHDQKDDTNNNDYDKTDLNKFFCNLLVLLQCDSNELNVNKFNQYIIENYDQFKQYAERHKNTKLSAVNYIKYLIRVMSSMNANENSINNRDEHQYDDNKHEYNDEYKDDHKNDMSMEHLMSIGLDKIMSIGSNLNEYLDGSDSMDYQDFNGFCREFVGDIYPQRNIKIAYQFISQQQENTEVRVAFFLRIIAKYGKQCDHIDDIMQSVLDNISYNVLKNRQSELIETLRSHLQNVATNSRGTVSLEEFANGLKAANVTSISVRDMKKIFNLCTTNNSMNIKLFMKRFKAADSTKLAIDCNELIINVFEGIVKKRNKKRRKKKKKMLKKIANKEIIIKKQNEELEKLKEEEKKKQAEIAKLKQQLNVNVNAIQEKENVISKQKGNMQKMSKEINENAKKLKEITDIGDKIIKQQKEEIKSLKNKRNDKDDKKEPYAVAVLQKKLTEAQKENKKLKKKMVDDQKTQIIVTWEWKENNNTWTVYPDDISKQIESMPNKHSMQYTFSTPNHVYKIEKKSAKIAIQTNVKTNVSRDVRRIERKLIVGNDNAVYPIWWNASLLSFGSQYATPKLVELSLSDPTAKQIENEFYKTANNYKIIKIESVQNQMLYDSYWNEKKKLLKLIGEKHLNERKLFHGTKHDVMEKIQIQGFRKEFNSRARYGEGTYFAKDASYSVHYSQRNVNGICKMFLCHVICGEMHDGNQSYTLKTWPTKTNGLIYDSLVDKTYDPSIFVIHENVRAYPMFVIHFQ